MSFLSVEPMWSARDAEDAGTAKRRRERRLRQFLRHERLTVAMLLAETNHHAVPTRQSKARRGEEVRVARHGHDPEQPPPSRSPSICTRKSPAGPGHPVWVSRGVHTYGTDSGCTCGAVGGTVAGPGFFDTLMPVPEQVIEVR